MFDINVLCFLFILLVINKFDKSFLKLHTYIVRQRWKHKSHRFDSFSCLSDLYLFLTYDFTYWGIIIWKFVNMLIYKPRHHILGTLQNTINVLLPLYLTSCKNTCWFKLPACLTLVRRMQRVKYMQQAEEEP